MGESATDRFICVTLPNYLSCARRTMSLSCAVAPTTTPAMLGVRKVAARKSREKCEGEMMRAAKEIGE